MSSLKVKFGLEAQTKNILAIRNAVNFVTELIT
jgi:hypothetical protein